MSLTGLLVLGAGLVLAGASSGCRAALPETVTSMGRDPSDRRREAALRLRVIWMGRVIGLLLAGAGSAFTAASLNYDHLLSCAALIVLSAVLAEVVPAVVVRGLPEGSAAKLFRIPMSMLILLFRLPALIILGKESGDSDDWVYTPPDTLWLEQRREKGDQEELEKEQELVDSILDFSDKIVREVMVPRIDVDCIELSDDIASVVSQVKKAGRSRIPVYRKKIDDIAGVLYAKDLLGVDSSAGNGSFRLETILREAYFVPEFKRIDELFAEFQASRIHMAVVVDEYGGMAGIVTMEDIVEEVFGDIRDEYDSEQPMVRKIGSGSYRIDARFPVEDLNDLLGTDLEEEDSYESAGGLLYHTLGRIPEPGDSADIESWRFTVEKVSGQRILFIRISQLSGESD